MPFRARDLQVVPSGRPGTVALDSRLSVYDVTSSGLIIGSVAMKT
jgi:hypothetical protein